MSQKPEIRQHNAITTARYEYTELQLDVFFYLLSKLRKDQPDGIYQVSVPGMAELTGKKYNYKQLREATRAMGGRCFEVQTVHNGKDVFRQLWMFKRIDYIIGTGLIEIEFNEFAIPYLFDLTSNFTTFQLYAALRLTSKYAKRLYTLCSQWKDVGQTKKYEIDELKRMLRLIDEKGHEEYTEVTAFKKFVLDVAVKQINEHTDLCISYGLEKTGRAFKSVVFSVKPQAMAVILPALAKAGSQLSLGLADRQAQSAADVLDALRITDAALRAHILDDAAHVRTVNRYAHDLKTEKVKPTRNAAGLLLTMLGLKKPGKSTVIAGLQKV